jgi:hypothetical protein
MVRFLLFFKQTYFYENAIAIYNANIVLRRLRCPDMTIPFFSW